MFIVKYDNEGDSILSKDDIKIKTENVKFGSEI